ncbi:CLUMA_CG002979, isoform A [Clunio marinus]|uniref:CLUMA_CG002979, isoform A n=1 Tax=Clunio marinus TaxID=568069 RepID=A0A1J1HP98_9DIPT|nr:CLUMA_CG002979, isoform A [Clunio marinus]
MNLLKINLISCYSQLQNLSSADETVHILNCTKIPLKFALNKLSETNGISNPSLVADIATNHLINLSLQREDKVTMTSPRLKISQALNCNEVLFHI